MAENQKEKSIYYFSKRIFALSILFLFINLAWYGVVFPQRAVVFQEVAPELIFAANQEVLLKTSFDEAFFPAEPNQVLLTGTRIKTGDQSFAEIQIEGNTVRLDQNTELQLLENNFQNPTFPRFVFALDSGSVWVNAFDPIVVKTAQGQARFAHTVGSYTYSRPLNRVLSIAGNVDLSLLDEAGKPLSQFLIPLKNQVTFVDSQIIPEYARLEYSKLKKELKMGPIAKAILEEDWVRRNTRSDAIIFLAENEYIFSPLLYRLRLGYHAWREKLAFIPQRKRVERLNRVKTKLNYLLGGVHQKDLKGEARTLLGELDLLTERYKDHPLLIDLMERQFYAIRNVRTDTPAYLVKENLRGILFSKDQPEFLRTYLADLDFLMRTRALQQAEKVAEVWLAQWKPGIRKKNPEEFEAQARIYHNLMLAYVDQVNPNLLGVLDQAADYRLAEVEEAAFGPEGSGPEREETLFEIALERLEISKYLVAAFRYKDAKNYLRTSYAKLNLAEKEVSAAAREIFLKEASLISERIAFAEQTLKGAAEAIEEDEFLDYLSEQERDKLLAERFIAFLEEAEAPEEPTIYPTVQEVSQRFTLARIVVLDEDIEVNPEFPFEFQIKTARLVDRAEDGSLITFSVTYDYFSNAVYNIDINGTMLKGNFVLEDFVRIAKVGELEISPIVPTVVGEPEPIVERITDFLALTETEEAQRSQIIAEDLAVQLILKELEQFNIRVSSGQQVTVLNPATLNEFEVVDAFIDDPERRRSIAVGFEYNSVTKTLRRIIFEDLTLDIPSEVKADQFISTVFKALYGKEQEISAVRETIEELRQQNLLLAEGDFNFAGPPLNQINFKKMKVRAMLIEFAGVYDRKAKVFIRAEHPLLTAENRSVSEYLTELSEFFVIDFLSGKGIEISQENIITQLPNDKIAIQNYGRGDKVLDFTLDLSNNRLIDITLQGTEVRVDSMTFEEFSRIE